MLHHSQSILLCSKHIAVWRCFKFTRTGSSNQTTVSLRSNSFKLQHHLEVLQLWCRFKPMGTARFVAEWEKPNSKWRKHAVQFTSQGPPLSQLAPMSNLGSCHKIPQGPSCQIETPELCVELYIFSPRVYEAHLPLSKAWLLFLFDLPTTIASQLDTIPHLAGTSDQNQPNGTRSHRIVYFFLECKQKHGSCASPGQLLHSWLKNAISTHHRCPEVCSTPACIGKCACQICCRPLLWWNGGSSFPLESRILSLLSGYYFYSHLCDWHGYALAMVADLEKNIR